MPPRNEVPSLFDLSLTSVGGFACAFSKRVSDASFAVATTIKAEEGVEEEESNNSNGLQRAERRAAKMVEDNVLLLRRLLFSSLPRETHQRLAEALLESLSGWVGSSRKTLSRKMNGPSSSPSALHEVHVAVRFCRVIVHPGVARLDLSKVSKLPRDELCRHLGGFSGLRALNLGGCGCGGEGCHDGQRLNLSLRHLSRLTSLTMPNDCQDETLAVVAQNCPHLAHLDVSGSSGVGDSGASWLLRCAGLRDADLYLTSVSVEGYARLLLSLPAIRSVGRCDAFGQVLEYIRFHNLSTVKIPIEQFHSRDMDCGQIRLLVDMCPDLTHVNLYVDEDAGDLLGPFRELRRLGELQLLACNFYTDGVDRLLRAKGPGLSLLHLEYVDELDMEALCCIADTCYNLEKLVLFSCDFAENFGSSLSGRSFATEPFRRLESLVCVSETAPNVIEFLLTRARNLRSVQFGSTAWFSDSVVETVLARGGLSRVEEIRILRSYELTWRAVELLLDGCPRLRALVEVDGWEAVSAAEAARLRVRVREENLDLVTIVS